MTAVVAGYWPPWTGINPNNATLEQSVRANSLDQMTPPAGTMNLNGQRLAVLGDPTLAQDVAPVKHSYGGWILDQTGWTRTSNTTFTTPTNETAIYTPGTKVRWQESAVQKYGVVASSSFAGVTTVTLMPTSDYVMAATPDNNTNQYAYGRPVDFPSAFAWAPTDNGFSAAPNLTGSYWSVNDGVCTLVHSLFANGTSNATTYTVNLPINASAVGTRIAMAIGDGNDNGAATMVFVQISGGGSIATLSKDPGHASWTASGAKGASFQIVYSI